MTSAYNKNRARFYEEKSMRSFPKELNFSWIDAPLEKLPAGLKLCFSGGLEWLEKRLFVGSLKELSEKQQRETPDLTNGALFFQPFGRSTTIMIGREQTSYKISYRMKCRVGNFLLADNVDHANFARYFEYLNIGHDGHHRLLRIMRSEDGKKLDFCQMGTPLEFEILDQYKKRRVADRVTNELPVKYALALGVDLDAPAFWNPAGRVAFLDLKYYAEDWKKRDEIRAKVRRR